jgi:hypothetical protein
MGAVLIPRFINTVNCVAHDRQETETGTGASETREVTTKKKKMAEGKGGDGWGQCKPSRSRQRTGRGQGQGLNTVKFGDQNGSNQSDDTNFLCTWEKLSSKDMDMDG